LSDDDLPSPERAFGEESRRQLLEEYFSGIPSITPGDAWTHIYRLLLWIDRTTGLAHCYESDKSQPGRPWYARSLAYHKWLSAALKETPESLATKLDWLFSRGSERLAKSLVNQQARRAELATQQRADYQGFPEPGEDPALEQAVLEELKPWLSSAPPPEAMVRLIQRVRSYLSQENKRKNLLGEGFEDALALLIRRLPGASKLQVKVRPVLHALPGFRTAPRNEKPRTVDLAVIGPRKRRILVTAKWSVRADREEQFAVDFDAYARLEDAGTDFEYVLVTNEFDAARLTAACDRRRQNAKLFSAVVHINPLGPLAAYGSTGRGAALKLSKHIESGRLSSLENWLKSLTTG
jgi:hypothetical protein